MSNESDDYFFDKAFYYEQILPDSSSIVCTKEKHVADSILYRRYENASFPLIYHIVQIDLSQNEISLTASPKMVKKGDDDNYIIKGESTKEFSKRTKSIVAINGTPFKYSSIFFQQPVGIFIPETAQILSKEVSRYSAVVFQKATYAYNCSILVSQADYSFVPKSGDIVLGGFFTILKDGELFGEYAEIYDSRTAIGFSSDNSLMFILVVEGTQKSKSLGLDFASCATILKNLGATDAIQLDGGHSSSLCIAGKNMMSWFSFRRNVNNLGIILE